ncbi:MAG: OmpA family protein [Candidatus Omnitrophica bacterium]|nr:OmpA family protein [Candidatus Omnitrophota bacterium]
MFQHRIPMLLFMIAFMTGGCLRAPISPDEKAQKQETHDRVIAEKFAWWPTDAKPDPVQDSDRGGYWWWPEEPGKEALWGNRGYIYIRKILFDEKGRPFLVLKRIVRNVHVYFDFDKYDLRDDAIQVLDSAFKLMKRDNSLSLLLTGHTDQRGEEQYNLELGKNRAYAVRDYFMAKGIPAAHIRVLSRGELDAVAPVDDLVGLQKDRNVHFVLAEVEEVQVEESRDGYRGPEVIEESENIEGEIRARVKKYIIQKNDSLWKIALKEYGDGDQWRRLYNFNRKRIKDPQKLQPGQEIEIPIE